MGGICTQFSNLDDYRCRKEEACKTPGTCLMCKGFDDAHQMSIVLYNSDDTMGMTYWIKRMRKEVEWAEATTEKKFFM
eukprot:6693906-Heterocapsa_arctica.AAC.1